MYPLLILREEIVCLIILGFLQYTSKKYNMGRDSRTFSRITFFACVHVLFDVITVLTVNNIDVVPAHLNELCHVIFYLSALFYAKEMAQYVIDRCYPEKSLKYSRIGYCIPALYLLALPKLKIRYYECNGTYSSGGPAAIIGYSIAGLYFIFALFLLIKNRRKLGRSVSFTLIPMMVLLIIAETLQAFIRELLFTGGMVTIVTVAFFFSLENPVEVFQSKMNTDALTGMGSRQGYEQDLKRFEENYKNNPSRSYIFVFFDLNNLRDVNNNFGHHEGDNYISLVANAINSSMDNVSNIYRIGGDEFVAVYIDVPETVAAVELQLVQSKVRSSSAGLSYKPGVAVGYAVSGPEYKTLGDVIKAADEAMYRNKEGRGKE